MKTKRFLGTLSIAVITAIAAVWAYSEFFQPDQKVVKATGNQSMLYTNLPASSSPNEGAADLTYAADKAVHAVVHVKVKGTRENNYSDNPLYDFFFGDRGNAQPQPVMAFGSGVIISDDGYIVTNNHVVDQMDDIEVVLNDRRSFTASVIGTDPSTDLALLKIDAKDLPYLTYGNSDNLKLGQWVLAVGNPYNLTSTVTAGIISAKARNINILRGQFAIESFLQTDAAVNPGNSGGALVDTQGNLVGINTAIASRTGAYSGNSFAIPVSIVKKVIGDLMEYGVVQRAFLGVTIQDVTQDLANQNNLSSTDGVYVNSVSDDGSAREAGIKKGDIILAVNNVPTHNVSELQEQISRFRPNDKVKVTISRNGKEKLFDVTLRNREGNTSIVKKSETLKLLGGSFEPASNETLKALGIDHGVKVTSLTAGKLLKAGVREGFIITQINNKPVKTVDDIKDILGGVKGGVYVEGIYPNGMVAYYAFGL
ncbi:MAG TPA: Do family serine endopeptidase [Bacteroidales bacterium]|nr:Do family serine endopeptidase [Bacteroidales bacterium]